ncbi:Melanoma-derived growth regulatory protein [Bienertia sinuspersici]
MDEDDEESKPLLLNEAWANPLVREEGCNLTENQRRQIVYTMLSLKEGNRLQWGAQTKIARQVGVNKSTISRLCKKKKQKTKK